MAGRRRDVLDVREMVRRWKHGETDRQVARDLGAGRHTVAKYHKLAAAAGWLARSDLPTAGEIDLRLSAVVTKARVGPRPKPKPPLSLGRVQVLVYMGPQA